MSGQNRANSNRGANNTSGYKGVHLKDGKHWYAQINVKGKKLYVGRFKTAKEAARAYDTAAIQHHGEFARTNFKRNES